MVHSADWPTGGARPGVSGSPTPSVTPVELDAMDRALELARRGPAHGPNPRVGCVLLSSAGAVLAEGWHDGAGTPHAEAAAVETARAQGIDLRGATAVVTLEPCNHTGRTPPCTELLLANGIARVVHGLDDPNPEAAGGATRLREAGVDVVGSVLADQAEVLLRVWAHAVRTGRPFVTLKLALTLDGRVAATDGSSRWITSARSRWACALACAEVIQRLEPSVAATRPSNVNASLSVTNGRPVRTACAHTRSSTSAWSASTLPTTSTPASRSRVAPPAASGFGSSRPCTTLAIPFASNSSVQGGVRPVWLHGSSVTTAVAPLRSMPCARAAATAAASACGVPAPWGRPVCGPPTGQRQGTVHRVQLGRRHRGRRRPGDLRARTTGRPVCRVDHPSLPERSGSGGMASQDARTQTGGCAGLRPGVLRRHTPGA